MANQTTGRAGLVALNLPTAKTIATASAATPIIVATTTPHLLQTNEIVGIANVTGNSAANGVFVAVVVTTTTIALFEYPAGIAPVAGAGAGTGGTLTSLGYGVTVPIPNDLTDPVQAASVNVALEALLDRTAYLVAVSQRSRTRSDVVALDPVYFGGSALETLGHTASGLPQLTVGGSTTSGTVSGAVTIVTGSVVNAGDIIAADLTLDYDTGTQTAAMAMALYGSIGGGNPFPISGALQVVPDSGSPLPAIGVRTRVAMAGLQAAPSTGVLTVALYVFVKTAGNTWDNLGGGALRMSVTGPGL